MIFWKHKKCFVLRASKKKVRTYLLVGYYMFVCMFLITLLRPFPRGSFCKKSGISFLRELCDFSWYPKLSPIDITHPRHLNYHITKFHFISIKSVL